MREANIGKPSMPYEASKVKGMHKPNEKATLSMPNEAR